MVEETIVKKFIMDRSYLQEGIIHNVNKGWSANTKYIVQTDSLKYLITVFDSKHYESKLKQYQTIKTLRSFGVKAADPMEICQYGDYGIFVTIYIDGQDAEESLCALDEKVQYQIGVEAGKQLLLMHQLEAPQDMTTWYDRKTSKHARYMSAYSDSEVRLKNEKKILTFIDDNIELMRNRPNVFQHDDFHVGNIIINNQQLAGIIDFELMDWGDPLHEFIKVGSISKDASIPFCIGQIHGYLGTKHPTDFFWRLYSLYLAMTAVSTVVWVQKFHPHKINEAMEGVYGMLEDHCYFEHLVPRWYSNEIHRVTDN